MTMLRVHRWLMGAALVAAGLASGGHAHAAAQGTSGGGGTTSEGGEGAVTEVKKDKPAGEEANEAEEKNVEIVLDAVIGSAATDVLTQTQPTLNGAPPVGVMSNSRVTTESFIFGGSWEILHGLAFGVRIPFTAGEIQNSDYSRGHAGFGNLEPEVEGEVRLAEKLTLQLGLGVALPTAQGSNNNATIAGTYDQAALDVGAIQRAAAAARGFEDDALFTPKYVGIVPRLKLKFEDTGKWHVDVWAKLENMIADQTLGHDVVYGDNPPSYIGELVFGGAAGYNVTKEIEPALRIWANAPLSGAEPAFNTVIAVVEPQLRFHLGDYTPVIGGILPIAGELATPKYAGGIRLALAGRF
ncbi:MAG TPA: hypothetical protein VGI39_33135 [Polyangiaceae bacterium]|jgi:hypothetical protein